MIVYYLPNSDELDSNVTSLATSESCKMASTSLFILYLTKRTN